MDKKDDGEPLEIRDVCGLRLMDCAYAVSEPNLLEPKTLQEAEAYFRVHYVWDYQGGGHFSCSACQVSFPRGKPRHLKGCVWVRAEAMLAKSGHLGAILKAIEKIPPPYTPAAVYYQDFIVNGGDGEAVRRSVRR